MQTEKKDRRVRKTENLLLEGLTDLMETKSINDITVRELADAVDINRSTFYLHYRDIYDMAEHIEDNLIKEFTEKLDRIDKKNFHDGIKEKDLESIMESIFSLLFENKEVCRAFLGHNGDIKFMNKIKKIISERIDYIIYGTHFADKKELSDLDVELIKSYFISGCIGLVQYWLDCSPEQQALANPKYMSMLFVDLVKANLPPAA